MTPEAVKFTDQIGKFMNLPGSSQAQLQQIYCWRGHSANSEIRR